jgi:casein kinase I family protein HRR25
VLKLATGATYSFPASAASSAGGGGGGGGGNSGAGLTIKKVVIEGSDDPRAAFGGGGGGGGGGGEDGDGGDLADDGKVPITGEFNCGKHGTYRLRKLLGKGGFGEVYTAENVRSGVVDAIKLEDSSAPRHQLKKEWKLYTELGANVNSNYTGIPRVYWFGRVEQYRCMLMQGLGMSLQGKFKVDNKIWSIETICRLAIQMINVLEFVHEKHIVHRDLKPGNILLDKQNKRLFLIDYGLSTYYADTVTGEHIAQLEQPREPAKEGALVGTATFCSVRAHEHVRLSRRDDIEEMSYLIAYFVRGNLPWQVSKTIEKPRRNKMIYASKKATNAELLFRGHPRQLRQLCAYSRELAYEAKPNYDQMRAWMRELLVERDADPDVLGSVERRQAVSVDVPQRSDRANNDKAV